MTFQEAHSRQRPTDKHSGVGLQGWSHTWAHVLGSAGSVLHKWRPELQPQSPKGDSILTKESSRLSMMAVAHEVPSVHMPQC